MRPLVIVISALMQFFCYGYAYILKNQAGEILFYKIFSNNSFAHNFHS